MSVGERPIADIDGYNDQMGLALIDKIFFADKVEADLIIDIGCADGTLIKFLANLFPNKKYVGYDADEQMIAAASKGYEREGVHFTDGMYGVKAAVKVAHDEGRKVCVILSSMIHEVYAYGPKVVDEFWQFVWGLEADYVAIRDMMVSDKASRPASARNAMRIRQIYGRDVLNGADMISQHEALRGPLEQNWSLIQFLLKYRYRENWDREVHENYLPISVEALMSLIPAEYDLSYFDHFVLPFIAGEVWRDFYIQMQDPTHVKMILRRVRKAPRKLSV